MYLMSMVNPSLRSEVPSLTREEGTVSVLMALDGKPLAANEARTED